MFRSIVIAAITLTLVGCSGEGDSTSGVEEVEETAKETTTTPPVEKKPQKKTPEPVVEEKPEDVEEEPEDVEEVVPTPPVAVVTNRVTVQASLDDYCFIVLGSRDESDAYTRLKVFYTQDPVTRFDIEQGHTVEFTIGHSYGDPMRTMYPVNPIAYLQPTPFQFARRIYPSSTPYWGSSDPYAGATYTFTPVTQETLIVKCAEDTSADPT